MAEQRCPECGMEKSDWSENGGGLGDPRDRTVFCCPGCAQDTDCTCRG
jgi:hypothetical protein